jgi:hypothetical protein
LLLFCVLWISKILVFISRMGPIPHSKGLDRVISPFWVAVPLLILVPQFPDFLSDLSPQLTVSLRDLLLLLPQLGLDLYFLLFGGLPVLLNQSLPFLQHDLGLQPVTVAQLLEFVCQARSGTILNLVLNLLLNPGRGLNLFLDLGLPAHILLHLDLLLPLSLTAPASSVATATAVLTENRPDNQQKR